MDHQPPQQASRQAEEEINLRGVRGEDQDDQGHCEEGEGEEADGDEDDFHKWRRGGISARDTLC